MKMYLIVRVIVHAKDEQEALIEGKKALDRIAEATDTELFIYLTFESKEVLAEWEVEENFPPVLLASSPEGMQLIEEGWQDTVKLFMDALERIKLIIQHLSPEQIMEAAPPENLPDEIKEKIEPDFIREDFEEVGGQRKGIWKPLYFKNWPITSKGILNLALKPIEGLKAYVIPAVIPY